MEHAHILASHYGTERDEHKHIIITSAKKAEDVIPY